MDKWLAELKERKNEVGRCVCNDKQYEAVLLVARRVQQELLAASDPAADFGEPVRWLLHGGPGTGTSHVVKLVKELFTEVLKWDIGVQFHTRRAWQGLSAVRHQWPRLVMCSHQQSRTTAAADQS